MVAGKFFIKSSAQFGSSSPVEGEGQRTKPSESEVNKMYRSYADTGGNVNEEIKLLNSISHVSARLARNLSILAASQSEEGGKENVKDGRNGTDDRRTQKRCCFY
jgi:hypothetical protein